MTAFQSTRPRGARREPSAEYYPARVVSIHAPARGATPRLRPAWPVVVSIHAPARGATIQPVGSCNRVCFNPRARAGRDDGRRSWRPATVTFQSTRPRGARRRRRRLGTCMTVFQSTRPRGARRDSSLACRHDSDVSIHAPARGATARCGPRDARSRTCFNPRARAGRDSGSTVVSRDAVERFNPRARAGRDDRCTVHDRRRYRVSIHAPARGATLVTCIAPLAKQSFQSTRPRGARHASRDADHERVWRFNPRARAGRDAWPTRLDGENARFNPRARAGRDDADYAESGSHERVSIHAPARGATSAA